MLIRCVTLCFLLWAPASASAQQTASSEPASAAGSSAAARPGRPSVGLIVTGAAMGTSGLALFIVGLVAALESPSACTGYSSGGVGDCFRADLGVAGAIVGGLLFLVGVCVALTGLRREAPRSEPAVALRLDDRGIGVAF